MKFPRVAAWTAAEFHLGFWVACIPAVKPLLRLDPWNLGWKTWTESTGCGRSAKYRVRSRASSPNGFRESIAAVPSFGGTDVEGWGNKMNLPVEIELCHLEHRPYRPT